MNSFTENMQLFYKSKKGTLISIFLVALIITCFRSIVVFDIINLSSETAIAEPLDDIRRLPTQNSLIKVAFIGDSLINRPYLKYNLTDKIQALLPDLKLSISNYASDGSVIKNIKNSLNQMLISKPDAVLLFWDSDCSDVDESSMSYPEVMELRANYTRNLEEVIEHVLTAKVFLAIAGPGVLGEASLGKPSRFWGKTNMLNDYREINRVVAGKYDIPYIDVREAFLRAIPSSQWWYCGFVTVDGEHLNERGTTIVSLLFAETIKNWFLE